MEFKQYEVPANGISLYVTELGEGPVVLFCHGFPDTSYTWRRTDESRGVSRLSRDCSRHARIRTQLSSIRPSFVHTAAYGR